MLAVSESDSEEIDPDVLTAVFDEEAAAVAAEAIRRALPTAGPDYATAIRSMKEAVAHPEPLALVSAFALYYGTVSPDRNPEFDRRDGIFWHHIEIVQSFALRVAPSTESRQLRSAMTAAVEAVKGLDRAWQILELFRVEQASEAKRERERTLAKLRMHAKTIRGTAYPERQRALLEDLLRPLDAESERRIGIALSALPGWWDSIRHTISERFGATGAKVRELVARTIDEAWLASAALDLGSMPRASVDELREDESFRQEVLTGAALENAHEVFCLGLTDLLELMPRVASGPAVRRALDAWSIAPQDTGDVKDGDVVLRNPVVTKPFVATGTDQWYLFCPWVIHHNPYTLIEAAIGADEELFRQYTQRRAEFLEARTAGALGSALPGATIEQSVVSLRPDGRKYENDVLALVDSYAIVAEAKAGRLGPEARRGRGRPLRDHIEELLVSPSQQARRLATELEDFSAILTFTRRVDQSTFEVDLRGVHRALTVAVTLDPVAEQLPRLADLASAGLTDDAVDALVYSVSLADLELVVDLLSHPSEFLHWLGRRAELARATWLSGDEMDLLGLYLATGFNLGEKEFDSSVTLNVTGMSDPIDVWHIRSQAGLRAERPVVVRTEWWEACLDRLERQRPRRWSEIGVAMCNVAPPEQRRLNDAREILRRDIADGIRNPDDVLIFHNGPPQRRTVIVGMIATSLGREQRERQLASAQQRTVDEVGDSLTIFMSWRPTRTPLPYYGIALTEAPDAGGSTGPAENRPREG